MLAIFFWVALLIVQIGLAAGAGRLLLALLIKSADGKRDRPR